MDSNFVITEDNGELRIERRGESTHWVEKNHLNRIEQKVDRILEHLVNKELTTSIKIGTLSELPDDVLKRNKLGEYAND